MLERSPTGALSTEEDEDAPIALIGQTHVVVTPPMMTTVLRVSSACFPMIHGQESSMNTPKKFEFAMLSKPDLRDLCTISHCTLETAGVLTAGEWTTAN